MSQNRIVCIHIMYAIIMGKTTQIQKCISNTIQHFPYAPFKRFHVIIISSLPGFSKTFQETSSKGLGYFTSVMFAWQHQEVFSR